MVDPAFLIEARMERMPDEHQQIRDMLDQDLIQQFHEAGIFLSHEIVLQPMPEYHIDMRTFNDAP